MKISFKKQVAVSEKSRDYNQCECMANGGSRGEFDHCNEHMDF